jgi:hypothetical protein
VLRAYAYLHGYRDALRDARTDATDAGEPDDTRVTVLSIVKTCESSPAQWEGLTADGKVVYVRYRYGVLRVGIGADTDEAVENAFAPDNACMSKLGEEWEGDLRYDEMTRATRNAFIWPTHESTRA